MCGRYSITTPIEALARLFRLDGPLVNLAPRYNVAPSQTVPVIRPKPDDGGEGRALAMLRWGLVPSWAKDPAIGTRMINARAEMAAEKPAFRAAMRARRCLVPADGFYEWRKLGKAKQPYLIRLADGGPFAFAGLWERWQGPDGALVESCAILTTTANPLCAPIHPRMPVILAPADHAAWLDIAGRDAAALGPLLRPYPAAGMVAYPLTSHVNSPRNDDPACRQPATEAPAAQGRLL